MLTDVKLKPFFASAKNIIRRRRSPLPKALPALGSPRTSILSHISLSNPCHDAEVPPHTPPPATTPVLNQAPTAAWLNSADIAGDIITERQEGTSRSEFFGKLNSTPSHTISPKLSPNNEDVINILDVACNKRSAQSIRRHLAEMRVRQCEASLKTLQQALLDADADLQETEINISRLRALVGMHPALVRNVETQDRHMYTTFYDSNSSLCSYNYSDSE